MPKEKDYNTVFDKNYKSPATKDGAIPAMRRVESMYNEFIYCGYLLKR